MHSVYPAVSIQILALKKHSYMEKIDLITVFLCICVVGILVLGLKPKDYSFSNQIKKIEGRPGIRFGRYGLAHTVVSFPVPGTDQLQPFTIEMVLQPARTDALRFQSILMVHGGEDASQFIVGQWRSSIVVMNGAQYDGSAGHKTIFASKVLSTDKPSMVTVTSGSRGSSIYINGLLVKQKRSLQLRLPGNNDGVSLVLGNGIHSERGWQGDVLGMTIYMSRLPAALIQLHQRQWMENGRLGLDGSVVPYLNYDLTAHGDAIIPDIGPLANHLIIPKHRKSLKPNILLIPWYDTPPRRSDIPDFVFNILGFIPLGYLLMAQFYRRFSGISKLTVFIVVAMSFTLSLMIEITQGFMPSRTSTATDLLSNTLGSLFGVLIWCAMKFMHKKIHCQR
jgi:VanZ family protein